MISPLPLFSFSSIQSRPPSSFGRRDAASAYNVSLRKRKRGCNWHRLLIQDGAESNFLYFEPLFKGGKIFLLLEDARGLKIIAMYSFCFYVSVHQTKFLWVFYVFAFFDGSSLRSLVNIEKHNACLSLATVFVNQIYFNIFTAPCEPTNCKAGGGNGTTTTTEAAAAV